jgi:CPA2 family monovalent cation:H+ antiporter-2
LESERGRIAVGWLIVEDLVTVLALVLIPAMANVLNGTGTTSGTGLATVLVLTVVKITAFVAFMLIVGRRAMPAILHWVAHTGSRELFRLAVLAAALGVAFGAAELFGVSFALGAFFAGMILSESPLSQRAAEESLPLRDAFAVLFFVSVGMLFDPSIVVEAPLELAATLAIILVGKSIAAFLIVRAFGRSTGTALTISASLAQIGEFSFILAGLGVSLGMLPEMGQDLILAGAIISILLNPVVFALIDRVAPRDEAPKTIAPKPREPAVDVEPTSLTDHTVVVGYGRVGRFIGARLKDVDEPLLVIEDRSEPAEIARSDGAEVIFGNAADPKVLAAANLPLARRVLVAIPEGFEAGQVVEQARAANADLEIVARAHSEGEIEHLQRCGASRTVMAEHEIALGMLRVASVSPQATSDPGLGEERTPLGAGAGQAGL